MSPPRRTDGPALVRLALAVPVVFECGCTMNGGIRPPSARVIRHEMQIHGMVRNDNYYWLRQRDDPEVIRYLEAENRYTEAMMKHTEPLQERLFQEMKGRIKETDQTVPVKIDDYYYYSRTFEGRQYAVHCRRHGSLDAPEQVLLDENELAAGREYFRLGVIEPSPDHRLLAYSEDIDGSESFTLRVKDLSSGRLLPDAIPNTYYALEWAADGRTFFYTVLDPARRPYKVLRHALGDDPSRDVLVHHEEDAAFNVGLSKTRSRRFILIEIESITTTEVRFLEADRPADPPRLLRARRPGVEYYVDHHGDDFYLVTNDQATNFRVMRTPVDAAGRDEWLEVIPHRDDVLVDQIDLFRDHLVVCERREGLKRLRVRRLSDGQEHYVDFPEAVYTFFPGDNEEFDTTLLRLHYTSLVTPDSVYDYDMNARTRELLKRQEVLGGYDPAQYASERLVATAPDGARVPISVVHRRDVPLDGSSPLVLYGYGAYGIAIEPTFSSNRVSLLDRGIVYAIAHVRGGEELGRRWYEDGKLLKKRNTFTDFIACAERLIDAKYTSADRLVIMGGSAGGLLMGAVVNMRPELFKAVVAQVPFVDVVNTMLDESIPLTVIEFEEWGNPRIREHYDYMMTYSPYDNVAARAYPHMLVTAGLNDPRVQYWEPAKWTAKLRALRTDDRRLLLRTNMGAGHAGPSGRYDYLREIAFIDAFILDVLGAGA